MIIIAQLEFHQLKVTISIGYLKNRNVTKTKMLLMNNSIETAGDHMSTNLITVQGNDSAQKVIDLFAKYNVHHILVLDREEELTGIISISDIDLMKHWGTKYKLDRSERINNYLFNSKLAEELMTSDMITVDKNDSLSMCAQLLLGHRINALPVMDGKKLKGIISTTDLLNIAYMESE